MKKHKNLFIILAIIPIVLILLLILSIIVIKHFVKPSIVRVTLPSSYTNDSEPFDLYLGSAAIDGSGDYKKMTKISDSVWEVKNVDAGSEKELSGFIAMKAHPSNLMVPPTKAASTTILPRVNGEDFQRGVMIIDYWSKDWTDKDIAQTDLEMKKSNIKYAYISPVWDLVSLDPVTLTRSKDEGTVQYNEQQLKNHITKMENDGIDVLMGPQLCCTPMQEFGKRPNSWWDSYFAQYETYILYHARIAEETGVKYFIVNMTPQANVSSADAPADIEDRWVKVLDKVKSVYHGKVGLLDYVWGSADDPVGPSPLFEKDHKVFEKVDFFWLSPWNPLTTNVDPTQEELNKKVAQLLDNKAKPIYNRYKKPIIIEPAYPSGDGASLGVEKYNLDTTGVNKGWKDYVDIQLEKGGLFKSTGTITAKIPLMTYDGREQAMIYEAWMNAVASRNWITGFYPFVYRIVPFDFPRQPDHDIRRKPAEKIIAAWYEKFKKLK